MGVPRSPPARHASRWVWGLQARGWCPEKLLPVPVSWDAGCPGATLGPPARGAFPPAAQRPRTSQMVAAARGRAGAWRPGRGGRSGRCCPPWSSSAASDGCVSAVGLIWGRWRWLNGGPVLSEGLAAPGLPGQVSHRPQGQRGPCEAILGESTARVGGGHCPVEDMSGPWAPGPDAAL